jgi:hypothetical protein
MKRLAWIALGALLLAPASADAAKKSILRFNKKTVREAPPAPPREDESGLLLVEKTPLLGGSSQEGWLLRPEGDEGRLLGEMVRRPDWFGEKFPEKPRKAKGTGAATKRPSDEAEAPLPGTPVETEAVPPLPRREPTIRRGVRYLEPPPRPSSLPGLGSEERPAPTSLPSLPARPEQHVPFTYQVTPPVAETPRGYSPSVAPRGEPRLPSAAPIVTGQPPPAPRVLPRLAPYGTALPPDQTEPPAALPR